MAKVKIYKGMNLNHKKVTKYDFVCPACDQVHTINNSWKFNGDVDNPTFSPSVLVQGARGFNPPVKFKCHSFIKEGKIQYLSDCSHEFAGKTVDMVDVMEVVK